jgi:hypothetical protein
MTAGQRLAQNFAFGLTALTPIFLQQEILSAKIIKNAPHFRAKIQLFQMYDSHTSFE